MLNCKKCGGEYTLVSLCIHAHKALLKEDGAIDWDNQTEDTGDCFYGDAEITSERATDWLKCRGCGGTVDVKLDKAQSRILQVFTDDAHWHKLDQYGNPIPNDLVMLYLKRPTVRELGLANKAQWYVPRDNSGPVYVSYEAVEGMCGTAFDRGAEGADLDAVAEPLKRYNSVDGFCIA